MDRTGADFYRCVDMIKSRLGATPLVTQLPLGVESDFLGVIDLLEMKQLRWKDESLGAEFISEEINENLLEDAKKWREQLIETAVEQDDAAMESYLDGNEPSIDVLKLCIRKGTLASSFVPVLCGSAFKNKGVQPMLDAVIDYLPSPSDIPPVKGINPANNSEMSRKLNDEDPFSALAFKIMNDPFVGTLTFCRVYSGVVEAGTSVLNTVKDNKERVGRMLLMHANHREDVKEARSGDIIAVAGLKNVTTGDTLCESSKPIILERMEFPDPVIEVAVEPKTKADQEKMGVALGRLAAEDPSFRVTSDHDSGQTIIKGMGELHLDILVDRMKREFKVEANVGAPQVAYRETITREADVDYTHKKQSGGAGQFARVKMTVKPGEPGCGLQFENTVVGGNIPKEYIPGVEKGIEAAMTFGVVAGFPVTDVHVVLYDGAFHDVDSSVMAFELAGRAAFREALGKAGPKLLEPIMRVEVITPEESVGDVIGDLNSRRGQVQEMEPQGVAKLVKAMVPLATMFGYVNNLRSLTQGRANYSMFFEKYEQCPEMIAEEVKKKMA